MPVQETSRVEVIRQATFRVAGHCRQCATTLEQALSSTDGVHFARVDHYAGDTTLEYDANLITVNDLRESIECAGFHVTVLPSAEDRFAKTSP